MKPELYITYLLPQHDHVLSALCELGARHFAGVTREIPQEVIGHLRDRGVNFVALEPLVPDAEKLHIQHAAARDADQIAAILGRRPPDGFDADITVDQARRHAIVLESLGDRLAHDRIFLAALDRLANDYIIRGAVLSEDFMRESRMLVQWSKARGIPTFHITHGAHLGRPRGIYAQSFCDYVLLAGRRGGDCFADSGVPPEQLAVTGAPSWDAYPLLVSRRDEIRRSVREMCNLAPHMPLVTYAVTTFEMAAALIEVQIAGRTLHAFMGAARHALERGTPFAVIIKDRRLGGQTGRAFVEEKAREFGVSILYAEGRPEHLLIASDIVVASDSNISIEAIMCEVPTINIWSPMGWIDGPYYAAGDNILQARYDEPDAIGDYIRRLLDDTGFRSATLAAQAHALEDIAYLPDGNAAKRCARFVIEKSAEVLAKR